MSHFYNEKTVTKINVTVFPLQFSSETFISPPTLLVLTEM